MINPFTLCSHSSPTHKELQLYYRVCLRCPILQNTCDIVTAIHELYGRGKGTNYTYCIDWRPVNNHNYFSKKTHSFALGELKTQNAFCQNMFSQVSWYCKRVGVTDMMTTAGTDSAGNMIVAAKSTCPVRRTLYSKITKTAETKVQEASLSRKRFTLSVQRHYGRVVNILYTRRLH